MRILEGLKKEMMQMLSKKNQELLSDSLDAYQKICLLAHEHIVSCRKSGGSVTRADLIAQYDLQLHLILLEVAGCFGRELTSSEKVFLQTMMENSELIIAEIPNFFQYFYNMTEASFDAIRHCLPEASIHSALRLALQIEKDGRLGAVEAVKENLGTILTSFAKMARGEMLAERESRVKGIMARCEAFINGVEHEEPKQKTVAPVKPTATSEHKTALDELNALIGLENIKKELKSFIHVLEINKIRTQNGLPPLTVMKHMLFLGNPGTAKTTVARIVAKIFKEYGVVSKGVFVEANRESFVASVVGGTAIKTQKLLEKARGGVLFVDEAYALVSEGYKDDFGYEAISILLKYMEDHSDLAVIFAGYPKEMDRLLQSNPGLRSRFRKSLYFRDYTSSELMKIFLNFSGNLGYHISKEAEQKLLLIFHEAYGNTDFGNGRGVRNVFETLVERQASRLLENASFDPKALSSIEEADVPSLNEFLKTRKKKTHQMGFAV